MPRHPEFQVKITHPERVVYADDGVTKGDIADYYRAVARWLLPELARRPLALLRCPEGIRGDCFFQKHYTESLGDKVKPIALMQKSGIEDYLFVDDVDGVLGLVQMNTLEFHPWGSLIDAPERPDRLVFDLDPDEDLSWKTVVAGARDVRTRLRELGLESFVRLSGGKGLHVVVPIARGPGWNEVRHFCESFALAMAEQQPQHYVATLSKVRRHGRIFIDWLRNARGSTSIASWSLRARPGAPVAMPLRWQDLGRIKSADQFTLAKARQRAGRLAEDPWAGIESLDQQLPSPEPARALKQGVRG